MRVIMLNKKTDSKIVYVGMAADIIHVGHINIINEANKYGNVIIGLLTDEAIKSYKRMPINNFEARKIVISSIKGISKVIEQTSLDYTSNLDIYKPDFIVHGDDWLTGPQKHIRTQIEEQIKKWGGKIIDVPYTKNISTSEIINKIKLR